MPTDRPDGTDPDPVHREVVVPEVAVVRAVGWVLVVAGAAGVTVGAFLPWVRSGASSRDSFGVVRAARRLGVVDSDALRTALALWYLVPLMAAVVVLLLALRRERSAGVVAVAFGLVVLVVSLMVATSSADLGVGPAVASAAGVTVALGGVLVVRTAGAGSGGRT